MSFFGNVGGSLSGTLSEIAEQYDGIFHRDGGVLALKAKKFREKLPEKVQKRTPGVDSPDLSAEDASLLSKRIQDSVDGDVDASKGRLQGLIEKGTDDLGENLVRKLKWGNDPYHRLGRYRLHGEDYRQLHTDTRQKKRVCRKISSSPSRRR